MVRHGGVPGCYGYSESLLLYPETKETPSTCRNYLGRPSAGEGSTTPSTPVRVSSPLPVPCRALAWATKLPPLYGAQTPTTAIPPGSDLVTLTFTWLGDLTGEGQIAKVPF